MRKHCRRRPVAVLDPIRAAIWGAALVAPDVRQALVQRAQAARLALTGPDANLDAWRDMADACNRVEAFTAIGLGLNHRATVQAAQTAIRAAIDRANAGQGWQPTTLQALQLADSLGDLVDAYDALLAICSNRELVQVDTLVNNQVQGALAGNTGSKHVAHDNPTSRPAA